MFLERCDSDQIVRGVVVVGFVASLAGLVILAVIRGDIVLVHVKHALSAIHESGAASSMSSEDAVRFYKESGWKLQLFFALLAVSMELAAGLAVWEARKNVPASQAAADGTRRRLSEIDEVIPLLVGRITFLENEPLIFEAQFNRDYQRGLLLSTQSRGVQLGSLILVGLLAFGLTGVARAETLTIVQAVDFSQSDVVAMHGGTSAHEQNVDAAAKTILDLPPGSRFTVIGITADSFSRPLILVSGQIPTERGQLTLLDQVAVAKTQYAAEVRRAANLVKPSAPKTDIIGSLLLAADIFSRSPMGRHVLVIFSDMRQSGAPVNIEDPPRVPVAAAMKTAERLHLVADLQGAEMFVYGVHAVGKDLAYWQSLREFWQMYCAKSGATLRAFSTLREVPDFSIGDKLEQQGN